MTASGRVDEARLDEWQRLADEATGGPWQLEGAEDEVKTLCGPIVVSEQLVSMEYLAMDVEKDADAEFMVAAREAVPLLVAEVRRLQAQVEAVEALCDYRVYLVPFEDRHEDCVLVTDLRAALSAAVDNQDQEDRR